MLSLKLLQKRAILLVSHYGCGVFNLYNNLIKINRINGFARKIPKRITDYDDPACTYLFTNKHSYYRKDKIYLDILLFNYQLSCKELFKNNNVEFLFYLGNGISTVENIASSTGLEYESAKRYYCFRLRRICEMIEKIPNSHVFIEGISKVDSLSDYLSEKYKFSPKLNLNYNVSIENKGIPENCFERYYAFIENCNEKKYLKII